jgi:hypothetical protein
MICWSGYIPTRPGLTQNYSGLNYVEHCSHFYLRLCCMTLVAVTIAEETIPLPDEPILDPGASTPQKKTLTRANVFPTIIALCFSCLTQLYGSLLDTKDTTWLRRLSPIPPLVEGIIILFCLLSTPPAPLDEPTTGRDAFASQDGADRPTWWASLSRWWVRLQRWYAATAGALLLISPGAPSSDDLANAQFQGTRMRRILVFTAPSVFQILVETCATSGAPFIVFCTVVYFSTWALVQALLLLVYFDGMKPAQSQAVQKRLPAVVRVVRHVAWS